MLRFLSDLENTFLHTEYFSAEGMSHVWAGQVPICGGVSLSEDITPVMLHSYLAFKISVADASLYISYNNCNSSIIFMFCDAKD